MKRQSRNRKKIILGITGSFGSGKTTVARMFASAGIKLIDADNLAHRIIRPKAAIYRKIINIFGRGILKKGEAVDRRKLAAIVFGNKSLLKKLNNIMHPVIIRVIQKEIDSSSGEVIVLDAPLLIEAGLRNMADKLIVVKTTRKKQIERLLKRTALGKSDILKRIKMQIPLLDKAALADFIIDNNGTIRDTRRQVKQILKKVKLSRL